MTPTLQMRKLRLREGRCLVQGHPASVAGPEVLKINSGPGVLAEFGQDILKEVLEQRQGGRLRDGTV